MNLYIKIGLGVVGAAGLFFLYKKYTDARDAQYQTLPATKGGITLADVPINSVSVITDANGKKAFVNTKTRQKYVPVSELEGTKIDSTLAVRGRG